MTESKPHYVNDVIREEKLIAGPGKEECQRKEVDTELIWGMPNKSFAYFTIFLRHNSKTVPRLVIDQN